MHRAPPRPIVPLFAGLLVANAAAWAWAWIAFGERPVLLGTALLAWVFGLRHAVDADHIAAIDNVVRRQMQAGARPISVGLWFSLGHATVVVLASLALVLAARGFRGPTGRRAGDRQRPRHARSPPCSCSPSPSPTC